MINPQERQLNFSLHAAQTSLFCGLLISIHLHKEIFYDIFIPHNLEIHSNKFFIIVL
jgi:hypothetical protein